jgi:hypothetical protein
MTSRRFPPPWDIEEANASCFIVKDNNGQALAYVCFERDPGRRTAACSPATKPAGCSTSRAMATTCREHLQQYAYLLRARAFTKNCKTHPGKKSARDNETKIPRGRKRSADPEAKDVAPSLGIEPGADRRTEDVRGAGPGTAADDAVGAQWPAVILLHAARPTDKARHHFVPAWVGLSVRPLGSLAQGQEPGGVGREARG